MCWNFTFYALQGLTCLASWICLQTKCKIQICRVIEYHNTLGLKFNLINSIACFGGLFLHIFIRIFKKNHAHTEIWSLLQLLLLFLLKSAHDWPCVLYKITVKRLSKKPIKTNLSSKQSQTWSKLLNTHNTHIAQIFRAVSRGMSFFSFHISFCPILQSPFYSKNCKFLGAEA